MSIRIGEKIKALRKESNISQNVLAEHIGVSYQSVSKWENGICMPDISVLPLLAAFFDITIDELLDYNKERIKASNIELYYNVVYTLLKMSIDSRKYGLLSLAKHESENHHFLISAGIDCLLKGASPDHVKMILDNKSDNAPDPDKSLHKCIICGICEVSKGTDPMILKDLLCSFLPVVYQEAVLKMINTTNEFDVTAFEKNLYSKEPNSENTKLLEFVLSLNNRQIQSILCNCDQFTLSVALLGASGKVCEEIFKNVSLDMKKSVLFKMHNLDNISDDFISEKQRQIYNIYNGSIRT